METTLLVYFLKVNLAMAVLYICYTLLFRNDTFFRLRRAALLSIYLIAFLYPLLDISAWLSNRESVTEMINLYSAILPQAIATTGNDAPMHLHTSWPIMIKGGLLLIYLAGVALLLVRCLIELFTVIRIRLIATKRLINGTTVYQLPKAEEAYSFFGWIFIAPEGYSRQTLEEILVHEKTHVRQLHSIDVVLAELAGILCWINPFAWLLKREIGSNHEYLADEQVMLAGYNKKEYQYHLIGLEHPDVAIAKLYNNFSVLPLKRRITMLNKKRTGSVGKVKYLTLLPLAAGLLLLNNIDAMARIVNHQETVAVEQTEASQPLPPDEDKVYEVAEVMPEFPGGQMELLKFLARNIKYPAESVQKKEEGRVQMGFIINKDGSVSDVRVLKGVSPALDAEAIRVIKSMPTWTPGKVKGEIVRISYTAPITFKLQ